MTMLAAIAALAMAMGVGYYFGRRAKSTPPSWKRRTSRVALGRLAISLLVLLTARRAMTLWGPRFVVPLGLLRGSVARIRSY
ncbi:hypothetical protein BRW65_05195 [Mycobacterium paraffinicum]|uniref:Uncharacterized protein n=1 Tax=Mycobacterium paraffinicum TaxID=53378 RepID=A0A1Q4HZQ4_9MYCO|nr:hypothetical protein [Mycobacterium paraffinicum]OJZ75214.1 hypothetical protein BRW65_05195 [Mycobacterium paraffinicum]